MNKNIVIFVGISALIAAIFLIFPQIDLWASGLFFNPSEKFFLDDSAILNYLHKSTRYIVISLVLIYVGLFVLSYFKSPLPYGFTKIRIIYLILALAIGPGFVVNSVFKDNWGRARPHQITEFGGHKTFTPPFIISDQCDSNCSFVSGDPSVGFYFLSFMLIFPAIRKQSIAVGLTLGAILGISRLALGAHFFSDVIFSGIFTFASSYLLYLAFKKLFPKST